MSSKSVILQKGLQNPRSRKADQRQNDAGEGGGPAHQVHNLQSKVGNRGVQRLIAQRSVAQRSVAQRSVAQRSGGGGSFEVDDETAGRISRERGGGQPIDSSVAARMEEVTGSDLSGVRVHASPEAADISREIDARAFTTGQDIFFGDGAYQPGSSAGQELLAHELTHVVQQASGAVDSGGDRMTVNAPGDRFEQEADAVARQAFQPGAAADVQRQPAEEPDLQRQELEEDEELE